jgi:hypothetical protein
MYAIFRCLPELAAVELVAAALEPELELLVALVVELLLDDPQAATASTTAARPATVATDPREWDRAVLLIGFSLLGLVRGLPPTRPSTGRALKQTLRSDKHRVARS